MARAAQDSLKKKNYTQAATFAERAVKAAPQDARLWFLLGYTNRLAGRYQGSLDAYNRGMQFDRKSVEGLSGMAQTYIRMGRTADAKRLLLQVIAANPKRQNDLLMAGELFIQTGDMQQGINLLTRAENIKPSGHAELMLAIAYLKMKQPDKAKRMLEAAKRRDPKNPAVFRAVANYYREQHDYKSAIATLKSAPNKTPELLGDLGYSYELNGDKKLSAQAYVQAAEKAPKQIGYQLSAAQGLMRDGELDRSKQFIARATAIDANHYRLHAIKAALARQENRPADAIREYQLAIATLPQGGVPEGQLFPILLHMNLAELHRGQGNDAAARQEMATAEQLINKIQVEGPARAEFLRVRASVRGGSGDIAGAEADLKQALQLDPTNVNASLQYANLLWRTKRPDDAMKIYSGILQKDPRNRFALEAVGYLYRESGNIKGAEDFFARLAKEYPDDYIPYLALGDLYTATRDFKRADVNYNKAYKLAPTNPVIIANAANAAIEARQIPVAAGWVDRAKGKMLDDARVMRERERVFFHQGKFAESAQLGQRVLAQLPKDRNASVYLAYALYNLGRFDDVLALTQKYENILPREPNFPLLSGHVHKQSQLLHEAVDDYARAVQKDPKMVEAYVNRGYVLNDMQNAEQATQDFQSALKLQPNNGTAHLGLAFSNLQLRHGKLALDEVDIAEKILGESGPTHLARATAYRQQRLLEKAANEYRVALKYSPDDLKLHMALADTQYRMRRYADSIGTLNEALRLSPDDPIIYGQMAHAHAEMGHRAETLQYVQAAEQAGGDQSAILLNTGDALLTLGDRDGAMERFARALEAPDSNKVDARLAVARVFTRDNKFDDARQQIALAFAESRVGEASPVTADNLIEAANIFLRMNDFDLATTYFQRARDAGAADQVVAIGLANAYLAQGEPLKAQTELASLGSPDLYADNYDYTLAMATSYRQRRDNVRAITAFARANQMAGQDDVAERQLQEIAGEEGLRINKKWSVGTDFSLGGLMEDQTIYNTDRQLLGVTTPSQLPPPRSTLESRWTSSYRYHPSRLPTVSGFFQLRNARGERSLPSEARIINSNLYDYSANSALNPVLRLGRNTIAFNTGLQFTWRRDRNEPVLSNQNLFRQFVYMSTNSFFNWVAIRGSAFHESGPFTDRDLNSRELGAHLEFVVGRPWGRTQLITGYGVRDILYNPLIREFFSTNTSIGIRHQFGEKLEVGVLGEYIRTWRVQGLDFAIAQAMLPGAEVKYQAAKNWSVEGNFTWSRGQGFHDYDNVQSRLLINYVRPLRRGFDDGGGEVPVEYPLRFSFGIQNANYMNFTGRAQTILRPVVRLTLF
jgi:tetratricopeptide (TPR) repeat protein